MSANLRLAEKIALITGAAEGIGKACAEEFARAGATVVLLDRVAAAGEETAGTIAAAGGSVRFLHADVGIEADVEGALARVQEEFGRLDVLVCSAGIGGRSLGDGPVHLCTAEAWDQIMAVNLRGTFFVCKYALPAMFAHGGSIVTIASVLGLVGTQGLFDTHAYATSKAGIVGLTRTIAAHYARQRIRANVLAPGLIDTRMAARTKANPALAEQVAFWQPLGVVGQPLDVAAAALFLASDESQFITGAVLPVDGGWTVQ
jgi:NAD(P)-dependent dehydrogenase (short-subunit alcohol dehydrogenase family)